MAALVSALIAPASLEATDKQSNEDVVIPIQNVRKGSQLSKQGRVVNPPPAELHMDFVRDNLTATLYHEFAHALVDMLELALFGQEEDAADVLSVVMINTRHSETDAQRIARFSSEAYAIEADAMDELGDRPVMWDEHGPARQRYYNAVCLFYGAEPEGRADFADAMDLPESRADYCPDEYQMAARSWLPVLDRLRDGGGQKISFRDKSRDQLGHEAAVAIAKLIDDLNTDFSIPGRLEVMLKRCGSEDRGYEAFYSEYFEGESRITVCTEYVHDLYRMKSGEL